MNFGKFLRTPFLQNMSRRLLLKGEELGSPFKTDYKVRLKVTRTHVDECFQNPV